MADAFLRGDVRAPAGMAAGAPRFGRRSRAALSPTAPPAGRRARGPALAPAKIEEV